MKVSVIIPVYNTEKYIGKCLRSIEKQTLKEFEVIIVNDGSKDNSQKIIDDFIKRNTINIRCFIKKNAGQAAARNQGLSVAQGEYVAFVDSDDYLDSHYLETLYIAAKENNSQAVTCGYYQVDEYGKLLKKVKLTQEKRELYGRAGMFVVWGKLLERNFLIDNNLQFQEGNKIFEDVPYSICTKFLSKNPITIDYCGYFYVKRKGSTMNSGHVKSNRFPYHKMTEAIRLSCNAEEKDVRDRLEFEILHFFSGFLFLYCRKADLKDINILLNYSKKILKTFFPEYTNNPYIRIMGNFGQPFLDKCAVKTFVFMNKIGLINIFTTLITRI